MHKIDPIGFLRTPFSQKFGIPRQSAGLTAIPGVIEICANYSDINAFRGIEQFSHLWLTFHFHGNANSTGFQPLVRPPRLGGNEKVGVFASRSSFRPNQLGLSVVALEKIEQRAGQVLVHVSGVDCLDNTPIFDIKPYIAYADALSDARSGYAQTPPASPLKVVIPAEIEAVLAQHGDVAIIKQVLAFDPRPAYQDTPDKRYHIALYGMDIEFSVEGNTLTVDNFWCK